MENKIKHSAILLSLISVINILLTSIQLQVYNSMVNREKINMIWKQALMLILIISWLTLINLQIVIKTFILSIFEWPFYTGFTKNSRNNWKQQ